jgi:hypothetical protein
MSCSLSILKANSSHVPKQIIKEKAWSELKKIGISGVARKSRMVGLSPNNFQKVIRGDAHIVSFL